MNISAQGVDDFVPTRSGSGEDYKDKKTIDTCTIPASEAGAEERELIIEMMPSLRAFARSLTRNASEADDLVQETLLRALASLHQFRPGTNMKAWLFRIERNVFYTNYRKRHRECTVLAREVEDIPWVDAPQEWSVKARAMENALAKLPHDQREALMLVSGTGLSYEEAAEICGCALGTIKSRVSRARTRLLSILQVYHHEEFMEIERHSL